MGYLLDRVGAVVLPVVATFAVVSGSILTTLVDGQWQLFAVYLFLFGFLGQGSLYAPLMANISKWYDRRRGMAVGIVASGQSLSGIVWLPIFTATVTEVGWRNGFIGFGIIAGIIMLPMCLIFVRKPPSTEQLQAAEQSEGPDSKGRPRRGARNSATDLSYLQLQIVLCVAIIGCCISMALPLAHLVSFGTDFGLSLNDAGWIFSATLTAAFVSRILFVGLLSDRFGGLWALFCFFPPCRPPWWLCWLMLIPCSCFMSWGSGSDWATVASSRSTPSSSENICRLGKPAVARVSYFYSVPSRWGSEAGWAAQSSMSMTATTWHS